MTLPTILTIFSTAAFFAFERLLPGRPLPHVSGWYSRALLVNFAQLGITLSTARLWIEIFGPRSLFSLAAWDNPLLEGFVGWFIGTFMFYWWHRLRHQKGFWRVFHQVHHSPSRIEVLTSFYKHPVEILTNSILSAAIVFPFLGCSLLGTFWYNFFAATGEYFYHANFRSPKWLRYLIQTPELHSIHHQLDVHNYTTRICRSGIEYSEPIRTPHSSYQIADFRSEMRNNWRPCSCSKTSIMETTHDK